MTVANGFAPFRSRRWSGQIATLLGFVLVAMTALTGYLIWSGYQEARHTAETISRNYAATIEVRLEAALRRTDADLLDLTRNLPDAALSKQALADFGGELDAELDLRLLNFPELAGLRVYDADGDLLYTTDNKATPRVNIADRAFFRQARDGAPNSLAISEVITGRTLGRPTLILARAVRDERGAFRGIVDAAIELEYFQRLFQSLDIGPHGVIAVVRSDNFHLVSRWPPLSAAEPGRTLPLGVPAQRAFGSGQKRGTAEVAAPFDGIVRIFSFEALDRYPFYVTVGLARDDVLAGWRMRALAIGASSLFLLILVASLLYFLWRDVNARVVAEQGLAAARDTLADAFESIQHSIALYDGDDRLVLFNHRLVLQDPRLADIVKIGARFEDVGRAAIERGMIALPPGADPETFIAEISARHRRAAPEPVIIRCTDGRVYQLVTRPARNGGVITIGSDVTDQLMTEQRLRDAQRMEAIGKLTGGMAHDFNNYLGVIVGNLDLAMEEKSIDPEVRKLVDAALSGALRGAQLTRSLLAFSRQQPLDPQRTDVNHSLASVATLLNRTVGEDITLVTSFARDIWPVRVDTTQLDSCVVNLANNARDAMPRGGTLTIATRNIVLDARYAETHLEVAAGEYVMIEVSDTGTGMAPDTIARAFEPFFTTKPTGRGTGLGLSMVYGFVKQSGGHVTIYSEVGQGTTVRIYLPRNREAEGEATATTEFQAAGPAGGTESILVVEDKEVMRRTVARQLASLGYRVTEAENGRAALAILESGDPTIDLLFTDIVMPGDLDGYELARRAMELQPEIKVVVTSGFPGDALRRNGNHVASLRLLNKPYRMSELESTIRAALDSAPLRRGDPA